MSGLSIQHNMNSIRAKNKMKTNVAGVQKTSEKLGSGYKINRAGDNASGLAVSEKMRSQIRGLSQATNNAKDAISLVQTAEGGLNETHAILQRMRELTVQSSNGTYAQSDREAIQLEIDALKSEVNRISEGTEYNGIKLLDGSVGFGFKNGMTVDNSGMYGIYGARYATSDVFVSPDIHGTSWTPAPEPYVPEGIVGTPERPAEMPSVPETTFAEIPETPEFTGTYIECGDFKVYGSSNDFEYDSDNHVLTIKGTGPVAIEQTDPSVATIDTIFVEKDIDANIAIKNVNIDVKDPAVDSVTGEQVFNRKCAFKIADDSMGNVSVHVLGTNTLISGANRAGIEKNGNYDKGQLLITGVGECVLNAVGGYDGDNPKYDDSHGLAAGIGAGAGYINDNGEFVYSNNIAANILIDMGEEGHLNATAYGRHAAGIGGGSNVGHAYNITIKSGTIIAKGGDGCGSGIGGGHNADGYNIIIEGGTVYAQSRGNCPGIGSGMNWGEGVSIKGGTVISMGDGGEGIGGHNDPSHPFLDVEISGEDTEVFAVGSPSYYYDIASGYELFDGLDARAETTKTYTIDDGMGNTITVGGTGTLIKHFDDGLGTIRDHAVVEEVPSAPVQDDIPTSEPEPVVTAPSTGAYVISNVGGVEVIALNGASGEKGENAFWDESGKTLTLNLVAGKYYTQSDIDKLIDNAVTQKGEINAPANVRMILEDGYYIQNSEAWKSGTTVAGIRAYTDDVDLSRILINGTDPNDRYADTIKLTANNYGADNRHIDLYVDVAPGKEYVEFSAAAEQYEAAGIKAGLTKLHLATGVEYTEEDIEKILAKAGFDYTVTLSDSANPDGDKVLYAQTVNSTYICLALQGGQGLGNDKIGQTGEFLTFQIGANGSEDQEVTLSIDDMSAQALNVDTVVIDPLELALKSIGNIDYAIKTVSSQRAGLGALQNRLEHTVNNLTNSGQNLTAAESQIRDTNMATEMTGYTKSNILQQAAQAVLAQANQQPESVLQLLGNS